MIPDSRPVTSDQVLTALAALGRPASSQGPPTDRQLPLLLGALLTVVEAEIAEKAADPDRQRRVIDGLIAQSGAASDFVPLLLLAALRLERTAAELRRVRDRADSPDRHVMDLAVQTSRTASIAVTLYLSAAEDGYRPSNQQLQSGLVALETSVTDLVGRFNAMVARLHEEPPTR